MTYNSMVSEKVLMDVVKQMKLSTMEFITPICRVGEKNNVEFEGSGTCVDLNGHPYLMTNEHVARMRNDCQLALLLDNGQKAQNITYPFQCITSPTDVAIARIDKPLLTHSAKKSVPHNMIAHKYNPTKGEIMFVHGIPGKTTFSVGHKGHNTTTLPLVTDVTDLPKDLDGKTFFALNYPMKDETGKPVTLPDPQALSGTLVWDTQYVGMNGSNWNPNHSRVVGVLHHWDQNKKLMIGTRIEVVRKHIVNALRCEYAYYSWLKRNTPNNDALTDWLLAEHNIVDI